MRLGIICAFVFLAIFSFSCKTYTLSVDSFKKQLEEAKFAYSQRDTFSQVFVDSKTAFSTLIIDSLAVKDKENNTVYLQNSPGLEMRLSHINGKRFIVYFDTAFINGDTLTAGRSRFFPKMTRSIAMDSIAKIEIQNGGKKFN